MEIDTSNYTQTVEQVMREERIYATPLSAQDRRALFAEWCRLNPEALAEIESRAILIDSMGKKVASKYLIETQRVEGTVPLHGVPFYDRNGKPHKYAINNSDSSLLGRWLSRRYPQMRIEKRKSQFDGAVK